MKDLIKLNDYLYGGHTVLSILKDYSSDLKINAEATSNPIDMLHSNFLMHITDLLEHNDFLTSQSQRIREFYKFMANKYPYLAFTFKGRIKSLIRAEEKFNGYIVEFVYDYYKENNCFPPVELLEKKLSLVRDLIAYRIVISLPKCHSDSVNKEELDFVYEVADSLPDFLKNYGFTAQILDSASLLSSRLNSKTKPYYKDYIEHPSPYGYRSLHITLYDDVSKGYVEVQIRTKEMDDYSEIGPANHLGYEKRQENERARRDFIPKGENIYFDEAFERGLLLQQLELSKIDVNMFGATNNSLINDGCGLFRGRLILPYEHLSRYQNDLID